MSHTFRPVLLLLIAGTLAAGCAGPDASTREQAEPVPEANVAAPGLADESMRGAAQPRQKAAPAAAVPADRRQEAPAAAGRHVIRRADVHLHVSDVRRSLAALRGLAERAGGFVSDSSLQAQEGARPTARATLRVPARRFDPVLDELGGLGTVRSRDVSGEDVTMEFVDTESRIRNKRQEEAQLLKLLTRTGELSDVLAVERELARVRGEIEQAQGRLRHLSQLVDLATIEVHLAERIEVAPDSPWQLRAAFTNAWQSAQAALAQAVGDVLRALVWLVAFVLPLLVPAAVLFLLLGWAAGALLVGRLKLLDKTLFRRAWIALGLALVALAYPPLGGLLVLAAVVLVGLWVGAGLLARFQRRERD